MSETISTPNFQSAHRSGINAKMHATNDAQTVTMCGQSTTGMFKGGYHPGEVPVTCGNCKRILSRKPRITITIDMHEYSGYALDHDDCAHTFEHMDGCAGVTVDDETGESTVNDDGCDCDERCDENGGRWLDGDSETVDETSDTFDYEADTMDSIMAEREIFTVQEAYDAYVTELICSYTSQYRWLDWDYEGNAHECDGDSCFDYTVSVYGPGVTDTVKAMVFRAFAHR